MTNSEVPPVMAGRSEPKLPLASSMSLVRWYAGQEASRSGAGDIEPTHLWLGLCRLLALRHDDLQRLKASEGVRADIAEDVGALAGWFDARNLDEHVLIRRLRRAAHQGEVRLRPNDLHRSSFSRHHYDRARTLATERSAAACTPVHLALSLIQEPPPALTAVLQRPATHAASVRELLDRQAVDLSRLARKEQMEPCVGRAPELSRLLEFATSATAGALALVGHPGVGKRHIAEALALRLLEAGSPRRLLLVRTGDLLPEGCSPSDARDRLRELLEWGASKPDHVLVLQGLSNAPPARLSSLLEALRFEQRARVLALCEPAAYRACVEQAAGRELIPPVWLTAPPLADVLAIARLAQAHLETRHDVAFQAEAISAAVALARAHLGPRHLPGTALELLQQAAARAELGGVSLVPGPGDVTLTHQETMRHTVNRETVADVLARRTGLPGRILALPFAERAQPAAAFLAQATEVPAEAFEGLVRYLLSTREPGGAWRGRPVLLLGGLGAARKVVRGLARFLLFDEDQVVTARVDQGPGRMDPARPGEVSSPAWLLDELEAAPAAFLALEAVGTLPVAGCRHFEVGLSKGTLHGSCQRASHLTERLIFLCLDYGVPFRPEEDQVGATVDLRGSQ